jgi:hypothetical protein
MNRRSRNIIFARPLRPQGRNISQANSPRVASRTSRDAQVQFAVPTLPPAEQGNLAKQTVSFFRCQGIHYKCGRPRAVRRTIAFFEVSSADSKTHAPLISIRSTSDILLLAIPTRLLELWLMVVGLHLFFIDAVSKQPTVFRMIFCVPVWWWSLSLVVLAF